MKKLAELLTRHRNLFLLTLLTATLAVSALSQQERLQSAAVTVDIPVMATSAMAVEAHRSIRQTNDIKGGKAGAHIHFNMDAAAGKARQDAAVYFCQHGKHLTV